MIDVTQLIMVEPDASRLGWGVVRFSGYLQVCAYLKLIILHLKLVLSLRVKISVRASN